jgi:hypothetical protein
VDVQLGEEEFGVDIPRCRREFNAMEITRVP